jgi:hypothetical protein
MTRADTLSPHAELLWSCVAGHGEQEIHAALEQMLAASPIDWPACARFSIRHGFASILAAHLRAFAGDPRLPQEVAVCFERMLRANGNRNRVLFRELDRLLRGLQQAGIESLALKGMGLALTVYPDPALRNCADIDLLVHPGDLNRACRVAQDLGFAPAHAEADDCVLHRTCIAHCTEDILTETLPLEFEAEELRAKVAPHCHRVVVEIHQGLFRDAAGLIRRVDDAPLWYAPQSVCLPDGMPMQLPSPEVMLLHLAVHAADHGYGRLIYFHDIAATIRHGGQCIEWDRVLDLAGRYEVCGIVNRCLEFVGRECGVEIPAPLLSALQRATKERLHPLQRADIFAAEREVSTGIALQRLLLEPDLRRFCTSLRAILFPPPVIMRRLYGVRQPPLIALLYVLRPFLLTGHLMRLMLQRRQQRN